MIEKELEGSFFVFIMSRAGVLVRDFDNFVVKDLTAMAQRARKNEVELTRRI